jgi:hypothetical protein
LNLLGRKVELRARATRKWLNLHEFGALNLALNLRLGEVRVVGSALSGHAMDGKDDKRDAKISALRVAIDAGIAELDAGLGVEMTPDDLIAEAFEQVGLATAATPR